MRDIWLISDTHFGHENILDFKGNTGEYIRPFKTVEEMDELMIERWNSVVKPGDYVYHLGDVMFGSKERFGALWARLIGSKRLVVGNHDDIKFMTKGGFFKKITMWRMFRDHGALLTHVPVHISALKLSTESPLVNIHGHIHQNLSPTKHHFNVSVEAIDYTPIHLEDAVAQARLRQQKADDK